MKIRVGILQCRKIEFSLAGRFTTTSGDVADGDFIAEYAAGKILFGGRYYDSLRFEAGEGSLRADPAGEDPAGDEGSGNAQ